MRRKWHPTPVFLPGESQGCGSLVGCRLWGRTESDMTEETAAAAAAAAADIIEVRILRRNHPGLVGPKPNNKYPRKRMTDLRNKYIW